MARDHDPDKFGHPIPHDPEFKGPLKHRSCTDVLCLLLFLAFVGCWIGIGIYAFKNGDPSSILIPKASNGLRCGKDSTVINKPYLFFFDLTKCIGPSVPFTGCPTLQICVEKCPDKKYFKDLSDTKVDRSSVETGIVQLGTYRVNQSSEDAYLC
ncbi:hypothetical protein WA026_005934 [Henosepilachna vigintioctopunctata]|uniref:Uncharacterized protein n=1 Tax=Henosepilachna vigintioctopunctata TaxID=420089 RepID=A0AAW1U2E8_9CUCU